MAGKYTLHDVARESGKKLVQFAQMCDMLVVNTKYEDEKTHKRNG